jgi:FdhD protein
MPDITPDMDKLARNFYTTSSCGVCGKESIASIEAVCPYPVVKTSLAIDAHQILLLPNKLRKAQAVFEHTGGLHACALFSALGELHLVREDVGRHNAMDKLIGACLSSKVYSFPLSESIVLLSGRASFELMQKAAMAGVRMICAVGAPSSMAVHLAQKFDITLIGFLRDDRFNIYHGAERILN